MKPPRIYLDNAATSWPKPEAVYAAVDHYQRELGAPVGRGTYREAVEVERLVSRARRGIAQLVEVDDPRRIVFTPNCTAALNLAIHGLLRQGDHVVTTIVEHNSILRPLRAQESKGRIRVTRVGCDALGVIDPRAVQAALRPETRLVAVSHASNVTGAVQPIAEIGQIVRRHGAYLLVDAAQTVGHRRVSVRELGAHLLAASGHKGLLGPLGTGFLYLAPDVEDDLESCQQGGTGTSSERDSQPDSLPDKYEAGNLNAPGIVGLAEGVDYVLQRGAESIERQVADLSGRLWEGLAGIAGVRLFGPPGSDRRTGVVSLAMDGYDPQELAGLLDAAFTVQVRAGLHCAPLMHSALGTLKGGGTVRFSLGPFNTAEHVDAAISAVQQIAAAQLPAIIADSSEFRGV